MIVNGKTMKAYGNFSTTGGSAEGAVLYNEPQELTPEEQAQARGNIGAVATVNGEYPDENGNVQIETDCVVGDAIKRIHLSQDGKSVESIEFNGVSHEFDWTLITDIFDKRQSAVLYDYRNSRILYPNKFEGNIVKFGVVDNSVFYSVGISESNTISNGISYLHTSISSDITMKLDNKGRAADAYAVAAKIREAEPRVVDFYAKENIETYEDDYVISFGYVCDYEPDTIVNLLKRGIPVTGFFYDLEKNFLFSVPAVLQNCKYSSNTSSEYEILFSSLWVNLVCGSSEQRYICADNDGAIVWEH